MDLSTFSYSHIYWIFLLPLIGAGADIVTGWIQASVNNNWKSVIIEIITSKQYAKHWKINKRPFLEERKFVWTQS